MIINSTITPPNSGGAVETLYTLPDAFFLGGSRRMRELADSTVGSPHIGLRSDTDYDFYATWSSQLEATLIANGFKQVHAPAYLDDEAITIFQNRLPPWNERVRVVLRKDAWFYHTVFESIDLWTYHNVLWKSSPVFHLEEGEITALFNALFDAAHAAEARKAMSASMLNVAHPTAGNFGTRQTGSNPLDDLDW